MASPPFSLNTSTPGNSDIAANFPTLDRSDKDVIQSWLQVQMNNQGHDLYTLIDKVGSANGPVSAPTPSANTVAVYYDTDASLKQYSGDLAQVEYVGNPPGTILDYAGASVPAGYLLCSGQAVSRATYARLFTAIATLWGSGDGSTTFNVPDLRGRATFGLDNMGGTAAGLITVAGGNIDGTVLGNFGNLQNITLTQAMLPNINLSLTSLTATMTALNLIINVNKTLSGTPGANIGVTNTNFGVQSLSQNSFTSTIVMGGTLPLGGSGTLFGILPNLAMVNKIIKF